MKTAYDTIGFVTDLEKDSNQVRKRMNKKVFIWNMLGSAIYSLTSIVLVIVAKRMVGEEAGAAFYMAFTTGQMLLTIGYFEIRPFQVTDVVREYKPGEYFGFRVLTSVLMLVCGVAVGLFYLRQGKADVAGFWLIIAMTVLKMTDGVADVFEGEFQRNERMDISGKSLAFRTMFVLFIFTVISYATRDIYVASMSAAAAGIAGAAAVTVVWHKGFENIKVSFNPAKMKKLFDSTILLFLGSAMCMWIWNGTKYIVEWNLTAKETLIYGIIYMPTMVINLGSGFVFKPMLTTLAKHYEEKNMKAFFRLMGIMSVWTLVMTAVTLVAGAWLGIPVLSYLYDVELAEYKTAMLVLIVAGGFNALSIIMYYALMVMRRQIEIFIGYIVTFIASIALPLMLVMEKGLLGAAVSYLLVMGLLTVIFLLMIVLHAPDKGNKKEEG